MATPRKVNDRLIRLLHLMVERHMPLRTFNELVRDADQPVEIDENLEKFFRKTALRLTE
jgi:peptide subunit release factor RF-3